MIQAQINLPLYDNDGKSVKKVHKQLEVELCSKFGGCTTSSGRGKWLDNGKLYNDSLNIYQVAIDKNNKYITITNGENMRKQVDQKSLYVERSGDREIYYSYNTTVAVKTPIETYVSENVWSMTTAKHLNRIEELTGSDREYRMRYRDFRNFCKNNNVNKHYI
jgi:hypothetical protein